MEGRETKLSCKGGATMTEPGFFSPQWAAAVRDALTAGPSEQDRAGKLSIYWDFFDRVKAEGIAYGSGPRSRTDREINHRRGGRGVYFDDPNGHVLEILTV